MAKAKRQVKQKAPVSRPRKLGGRVGMIAGMPNAGVALGSLQAYAQQLVAHRAQIEAQLTAVQQALQAMGSAAVIRRGPGRPRGGGPRPGSLKDHIARVMGGRGVMTVKDITDGVIASGYDTKNKTLAKSVGIALTEMPNVAKLSRGKFQLS